MRCYAVIVPRMPTPTALSISLPMSRADEGLADRAVPVLHEIAAEISAAAAA